MTTATAKRSRRSIKNELRNASVQTLEAIPLFSDNPANPSHWENLANQGWTMCAGYEEARHLKADYDDMGMISNKVAIITPTHGGYEVRGVDDDPTAPMGRVSEVLRLVMRAEEMGCSVLDLMEYNPGCVATSSGNVTARERRGREATDDSYVM
jgi:hypothetical protein